MSEKRYIETKAVLTDDNKLIPLWDKKITVKNTELYGDIITYKDDYLDRNLPVVECLFDIKKKLLVNGIELNQYPDRMEYCVGDEVLYEVDNRRLGEAVISEILYEDYEMSVYRGKKIEKWLHSAFKNQGIDIQPNQLYVLKMWKPYYLLDNGVKIQYSHQLFKKVKRPEK